MQKQKDKKVHHSTEFAHICHSIYSPQTSAKRIHKSKIHCHIDIFCREPLSHGRITTPRISRYNSRIQSPKTLVRYSYVASVKNAKSNILMIAPLHVYCWQSLSIIALFFRCQKLLTANALQRRWQMKEHAERIEDDQR